MSPNAGLMVGFEGSGAGAGYLAARYMGYDGLAGAQFGSMLGGFAGSFFQRACFAAGTPLLWEGGSKPIEEFVAGERVWSRDEHDPEAPVKLKVIEETFVRQAMILHLHVRGQVIRTTAEHPFYVYNKGWISAGELAVGDLLSTHDGSWIAVDDLHDTTEFETVYNLRVADWHTYFVGGEDWGVSVWAHNASRSYQIYTKTNSETGEVYVGRTSGRGTPKQNVARRDSNHHRTADGFGEAELQFSRRSYRAVRG